MKCRYWDCGWCYAPIDVVTSASSCGSCVYPEHCPYLKTEMTTKQSKEKISYITIGYGHPLDEEVVVINNVKYKIVVETPLPHTSIITKGTAECVEYGNQEYVRMGFHSAPGAGWWIRDSAGNILTFVRNREQESILEGEYQKCKSEPETAEVVCDELTESWYNDADWLMKSKDQGTLYEICREWKDADIDPLVSDLIDAIEQWLPKEQSAAGSQNAYVECTVEGFNDCLHKIKSRLR